MGSSEQSCRSGTHRLIELEAWSAPEHGVGAARAEYMKPVGPALEVMRAIKKAFDPKGILNPGKLGL